MKAEELRNLPEKELIAKRDEVRVRLFNLRFKAATEPITNPAEVRTLRRDIARINTILTQRAKKGAPKCPRLSRAQRKAQGARASVAKGAKAKAATAVAAEKKA